MAKRMVLVDERLYDELWKRTPHDTSKSHLNNKLQSQLDSHVVPDDVKAKQYQKTLNRFLNLKQQVPDLKPTALNGLIEEPSKKKKKKKIKNWDYGQEGIRWDVLEGPVRRSNRERKKWSRYDE
jgi:hypothetical protein